MVFIQDIVPFDLRFQCNNAIFNTLVYSACFVGLEEVYSVTKVVCLSV